VRELVLTNDFGLTETCAIPSIDGRDLSEKCVIRLQVCPKNVCLWYTRVRRDGSEPLRAPVAT